MGLTKEEETHIRQHLLAGKEESTYGAFKRFIAFNSPVEVRLKLKAKKGERTIDALQRRLDKLKGVARILKRLKPQEGDTLTEAFNRFMKRHKSIVSMLNQARGKLKKTSWHGLCTVNQLAKRAGVSRTTIENDIQRELLTASGTENINGKRCLVFSNEEARRYKQYREELHTRKPFKRNSWERTEELLREMGPEEVARELGIKLKSLKRTLERRGKSFDDYRENERVYKVVA